MIPAKVELCLEVLSAVAWADEDLELDEIAIAVDCIEPMDYADRPRIQEILMSPHMLPSPARLRMLDGDERARLMRDAFRLASCTSSVCVREEEVLRRLRIALAQP